MGHTFDPDNIYHEAERLRATNVILKADLREAEAALAEAKADLRFANRRREILVNERDIWKAWVWDNYPQCHDEIELAQQAEQAPAPPDKDVPSGIQLVDGYPPETFDT